MSVQIVTGYTGERHITPYMDATVNRGIFGEDGCILSSGGQMSASMPDINTFVIADGAFSIQGHIGITNGETLMVDTCASGSRRIDLVVARFEHDSSTNIDTLSIVLLKGTETTSQYPTTPTYRTGTIADGANVDLPLYQINLEGSTVAFAKTVDTASASLDDISNPVSGMWKDARDNAGIKIPNLNSNTGYAPVVDMKSDNYDFSMGAYKDALYFSAVSDADYQSAVNTNKSMAYSPENGLYVNGYRFAYNDVLWTGVLYMSEGHVINLPRAISSMPHGIVLAWSGYSNGKEVNYDWSYQFVPKWHISAHNNALITHFMANATLSRIGVKGLNIADRRITGYSYNTRTGTSSGVTYNNAYWVLRAVIGV